jgi:hypothetical protein
MGFGYLRELAMLGNIDCSAGTATFAATKSAQQLSVA